MRLAARVGHTELVITLRALRLVGAGSAAIGIVALVAARLADVGLGVALVLPIATAVTATGALSVEALVRSRVHAAWIQAEGPSFGSVTLLEMPLAVHHPGGHDDRPWTAIAIRHGVHDSSGAADPELLVVRAGDAPTWITIDRLAVPSHSVHDPR